MCTAHLSKIHHFEGAYSQMLCAPYHFIGPRQSVFDSAVKCICPNCKSCRVSELKTYIFYILCAHNFILCCSSAGAECPPIRLLAAKHALYPRTTTLRTHQPTHLLATLSPIHHKYNIGNIYCAQELMKRGPVDHSTRPSYGS